MSDAELSGIVAWSDANRNGVSDPGEVVPITTLGVNEIRYRNPNPMSNGDLFINDGYSLTVNGKVSKGLVIDWYGEVADTKEALKVVLPVNAVPSENSPWVLDKVPCKSSVSTTVAGGWRWWLDNDPNKTTRGFLTLSQTRKDQFSGRSFSITEASKRGTNLAAMVGQWPMEAQQFGNKAKFSIPTKFGSVMSDVELLNGGQTLKGTTRATSGVGNDLTYKWSAERIGCGDSSSSLG